MPTAGEPHLATASIDEAVVDAMLQYGIVGCGVALLHGSDVVSVRGYGYAELERHPFLPDTASRCGSLAKPLTALCTLLLFDQGRVDLDEPILPILARIGIEPRPVGSDVVDPRLQRITVRDLMDHTSGLPNGATYTAWRPNRDVALAHELDRPATAADVCCDALGSAELISEPGTRYEYANANFVLLARIVEAAAGEEFNSYLTKRAMPRFGVDPGGVYVSRNQDGPGSPSRGTNEARYYQTSAERYVSYRPMDRDFGQTLGEAYLGYSTEAADGAGGIACTAAALGKVLANLHSDAPAISPKSMSEICTPPMHYKQNPEFDLSSSSFYSKGFNVRIIEGTPWLGHGGMTNHCGGSIGYASGYRYAAVSNWNHTGEPYVHTILERALTAALSHSGSDE